MPPPKHTCPICNAPVRPRDSWAGISGTRHHLACLPPGTLTQRHGNRFTADPRYPRSIPPLSLRLTTQERRLLTSEAQTLGVSLNAYVRRYGLNRVVSPGMLARALEPFDPPESPASQKTRAQ